MSVQDDDDRLRSVRAALSLYVGGALPLELIGTAEANGLPIDGWVFPPQMPVAGRYENLSADLADAGVLLREHGEALGVTMLVPGDPGWPSGTGADDLPCLWVTGDGDLAGLLHRAVAICGELKRSTAYGRHVACDLGVGLAEAGWTVVASAFPDGIAAAATSWTRAVDGRLLLVDAHGHDQFATEPRATGRGSGPGETLVSPFPPGTVATWGRYAVHHRLLGTLAAGTVVVEADLNTPGGAAANAAAETGRIVCAVPGPVTSAASRGTHALITSRTARLVCTAADVIAAVTEHPSPVDGGRQRYRITATASFDDGRWHTRTVPDFFVEAESAPAAADRAYEVVFAADPHARGATLNAGVYGPDGYEAVQVSSTS